jgi:hypothetical protein
MAETLSWTKTVLLLGVRFCADRSEMAFHQSGAEHRIAGWTVENLGIGSEFDVDRP